MERLTRQEKAAMSVKLLTMRADALLSAGYPETAKYLFRAACLKYAKLAGEYKRESKAWYRYRLLCDQSGWCGGTGEPWSSGTVFILNNPRAGYLFHSKERKNETISSR